MTQKTLAVTLALALLSSTPAFADNQVRPAAVWIEPLGTIQGAVYGWGYLSLGFEVPGGSFWNWMFSLGGVFAGTPYTQVWFTTGPQFMLGGGYNRMAGFFLAPKLLLSYAANYNASSGNTASMGEVHIGLDFGYRTNLGPIYIAPVIGISAGPCFGCDAVPASPPLNAFGNPLGLRGRVELNLNLIRLGAAF